MAGVDVSRCKAHGVAFCSFDAAFLSLGASFVCVSRADTYETGIKPVFDNVNKASRVIVAVLHG